MDVKDFDYYLPKELIAQDPLVDRSSSRLMLLDKETGELQHKTFTDVYDELKELSKILGCEATKNELMKNR